MIRAILCDIEGTTSSISFVHEVLFPLSLAKIDGFLQKECHQPEIEKSLTDFAKKNALQGDAVSDLLPQITEVLKGFIKNDVKDTTLKLVQGKIWKASFESGEIKGHVYEEVSSYFQKWVNLGKTISIYSSGSVEAQKLLFRYSVSGDLTKFLSGYYDTNVGPKREKTSYEKIAGAMGLQTGEILFLSDITQELEAAKQAGCQVCLLVRPGAAAQENAAKFKQAADFHDVDKSFFS